MEIFEDLFLHIEGYGKEGIAGRFTLVFPLYSLVQFARESADTPS